MAAGKTESVATAKPGTGLGALRTLLRSPDMQFAIGIVAIVLTMIVPLPPLILDLLLVISVTLSFLILLISIYVKEPLEFSTFPTVLLITTLFRLGLSVATTRNILLEGATGHVSQVIRAFGHFVVGGNYFVGFVIFTILIVINFIVITKGAGRVAEVGARFTLDAMPGKQMAIDAELNAGLIERDEAKRRRSKIELEADFYGAMDGASKFVRGDAIAGIVIAVINIVVGLVVGVVQYNMSFGNAAEVFTLLTVGDGLITQIPALLISTAAGIVVTRASGASGLSEELTQQVVLQPKPLYMCAGLLVTMSVVPGLPMIPFLLLAGGFYGLGRAATRTLGVRAEEERKDAETKAKAASAPDSIEALLHVDTLALEVGVSLIPLVDTNQDGEVLERIVSARKQFAQEMGIVVPIVMVRDNIQLKPQEYQILLKGNVIGSGTLLSDHFLAMDPGDIAEPIPGLRTTEPAYGLAATWIKPGQRDEATFRGYTVVNCATIIVTHLTKLIQEHAAELIGRQEVQQLTEGIKRDFPKVVEEVIHPDRLTLGDVVKVLQNLLAEAVSIRDLLTIFETLADHCRTTKHPDILTRYVRRALGRAIIKKYLSPEGVLAVATLDRAVEDVFVSGIQQRDDGSTSLQLDPQMAQRILNSIAACVEGFQATGSQPILLCGSMARWELHKLLKRFIPGIQVLAFDEIPVGARTQNVGVATL